MSYTLSIRTKDGGSMRFEEPDFQRVLDRLGRLAEEGAEVHSVAAFKKRATVKQTSG